MSDNRLTAAEIAEIEQAADAVLAVPVSSDSINPFDAHAVAQGAKKLAAELRAVTAERNRLAAELEDALWSEIETKGMGRTSA